MPIIKSAKKALKQSIKRQSRNDHFKDLYREARVSFEKAIKAQDAKLAASLYFGEKASGKKAKKDGLQSIVDKLIKKNIIHPNNGSRKKSAFAKKLKSLDAGLKS